MINEQCYTNDFEEKKNEKTMKIIKWGKSVIITFWWYDVLLILLLEPAKVNKVFFFFFQGFVR